MSMKSEKIFQKKTIVKRNSLKYSLYRHYKKINSILNEN